MKIGIKLFRVTSDKVIEDDGTVGVDMEVV